MSSKYKSQRNPDPNHWNPPIQHNHLEPKKTTSKSIEFAPDNPPSKTPPPSKHQKTKKDVFSFHFLGVLFAGVFDQPPPAVLRAVVEVQIVSSSCFGPTGLVRFVFSQRMVSRSKGFVFFPRFSLVFSRFS